MERKRRRWDKQTIDEDVPVKKKSAWDQEATPSQTRWDETPGQTKSSDTPGHTPSTRVWEATPSYTHRPNTVSYTHLTLPTNREV